MPVEEQTTPTGLPAQDALPELEDSLDPTSPSTAAQPVQAGAPPSGQPTTPIDPSGQPPTPDDGELGGIGG